METPSMLLGYLDPGTMSIVLQAALAAILSTCFILRRTIGMPFRWILGRLKGTEKRAEEHKTGMQS
jgi:hypothetical protein